MDTATQNKPSAEDLDAVAAEIAATAGTAEAPASLAPVAEAPVVDVFSVLREEIPKAVSKPQSSLEKLIAAEVAAELEATATTRSTLAPAIQAIQATMKSDPVAEAQAKADARAKLEADAAAAGLPVGTAGVAPAVLSAPVGTQALSGGVLKADQAPGVGAVLVTPVATVAAPVKTEAEAASSSIDTVRMSFPKQVQLTLSAGGDKVIFPAGIQDVPVALADHWFLKASGVILAPKPAVYNLPPTPVGTASVAVKK